MRELIPAVCESIENEANPIHLFFLGGEKNIISSASCISSEGKQQQQHQIGLSACRKDRRLQLPLTARRSLHEFKLAGNLELE